MPISFVDCTPELASVMEARRLDAPADVRIFRGDPKAEELARMVRESEVILLEHTTIPRELLAEGTRLKGIVFMGTGAESYVPLDLARERGIRVMTTPGYGNRAVAEHAMALTFAAARQVAAMDRDLRAGKWRPLGGRELGSSTVAVVGLGQVGSTYARIAQALGMRVAGWNKTPVELPCYVDDLDAALTGAHVVSLHLALNEQTKGIIDARRLSLLAEGAILVNTARAGLVDEEALAHALDTGRLSHAALDVFWEEPLPDTSRWRHHDRVTLTAHAAYMTDDAYAELWKRAMAALSDMRADLA